LQLALNSIGRRQVGAADLTTFLQAALNTSKIIMLAFRTQLGLLTVLVLNLKDFQNADEFSPHH
jgi:hypothetical protein